MNPAPRDPTKKLVLFHRDFQGFTGGHLKVWDYFNHVAASPAFEPRVAFTKGSKLDSTNPWSARPELFSDWKPETADVLFLAGTDWRALKDAPSKKPIINFIQHPRHADANSELRGFLKNRAVRICVSEEVAAAIKQTGEVNGAVFVIPNGIDLPTRPQTSWNERKIDILVCGLKAPELAREVTKALTAQDRDVECLTDWIPRDEYLKTLSDAKITVFLPRPVEGFYLPALEGMATGTIVVCPDCIGNRSFCLDRANCFRPEHNAKAIAAATDAALSMANEERTRMLERAHATALEHSLARERAEFLSILTRV
jgi:Glycosyl transferases group 1